MLIAELLHDRRKRQLVDARHLRRNRPECGADAGLLAEYVDAKPPAFGGHVGEVQVVPLAQRLHLRLGEHLGDVALELGLAQVAEFDRHQIAVHPQHRRHADRQVQIGAALGDTQLEEGVDSCHNVKGYP